MPTATSGARAPDHPGAATVFDDVDGDGALDLYAEPSSPCPPARARQACRLAERQITVLRTEIEDKTDTFVIPRLGSTATFCVGDADGCRGVRVAEPVSADTVRDLSACDDVDLTLWIDEQNRLSSVFVGPRPSLEIDFVLRELNDGAALIGIFGPDVAGLDRMLVWGGPEASPLWTSEAAHNGWRDVGPMTMVAVPSSIREGADLILRARRAGNPDRSRAVDAA